MLGGATGVDKSPEECHLMSLQYLFGTPGKVTAFLSHGF